MNSLMESTESKRVLRTSHVRTNYSSTTDNGGKYTLKKDSAAATYRTVNSSPELTSDEELQSHGISIVDTNAKNFSNVTPEEVSDYYKSLGEWQNVLPKTDYTYSPLSRYYTKKINGRIPIIPNMSRKNIWKVNGEVQDNEVNLYLAKNYEYEEQFAKSTVQRSRYSRTRIVRHVTTVTKIVRTIVRKIYVNTINTYSSTDSTNSGGLLRNMFLVALLALLAYFLFGDFFRPHTVSMPFVNMFQLLKSLVFNLYDLTRSSTTFLTSLISVFINNAAQTANTLIVAPIFRYFAAAPPPSGRRAEKPQTGIDIDAVLKRWFDENAENIAKKVVGSNEFVNFIGDRFRRQDETQTAKFEEFLRGYDFAKSPFVRKLNSLEAKINEWRVQNGDALKEQINRLKDEMETKEGQLQKEIFVVLSSLVGTDESPDRLKDKFAALFRLVDEAHRKVDTLADEFHNYANNVSENSHVTERLRDELNYNLKLSIEEMVSQRLKQWKESTAENSVKIDRIDIVEKYVNEAIRKALEIYDADKTGKPDFALESQGGIILSTRCTETKTANAQFSIFGIPLWHASRSPRTVIQPGVHPGECWAFPGSTGYLVIQLSERVLVTGFTMEHIPRSLAANGSIDSAPKDFSVWALHWEADPEPRLLGEFRYDDEGASVQYFDAVRLDEPYQIVELKILSNHGKMDYTCLYRFRVHGIPA